MKTVESAIEKRRLNKLGLLCAVCVLLATAFAELTPYFHRAIGIDWWFWLANLTIGAGFCVGILFSFWWAETDSTRRRSYYFFLCIFLLFFVGNATKGLVASAAVNERMAEFVDAGQTCKIQENVCLHFVSATNTEKRLELASSFYGYTGINLLGNKLEGSVSMSPTETARIRWVEQQTLRREMQEPIRVLAQLHNSSIAVMTLNGAIGVVILGLGGWVLGRRASST